MTLHWRTWWKDRMKYCLYVIYHFPRLFTLWNRIVFCSCIVDGLTLKSSRLLVVFAYERSKTNDGCFFFYWTLFPFFLRLRFIYKKTRRSVWRDIRGIFAFRTPEFTSALYLDPLTRLFKILDLSLMKGFSDEFSDEQETPRHRSAFLLTTKERRNQRKFWLKKPH